MHSDEFLREVLDSTICPDNFETIYKDFQHYQQLAMNTLNEFHRVCEKNSVPYQLAYGSLLGAIRDDGQIPWDYDTDVWVPYCEASSLIRALQKDLGKDYYFYCPEVDSRCRHCLLRVAPKGYRTEVIHLDVFYMIGIPDDYAEQRALIKRGQKIRYARYCKLVRVRENFDGHVKHQVKLYLKKLQYAFVSIDKLNKKNEIVVNKYPFYDATYCTSYCGTIGRVFPRAELWDTMLITNPCGEFRITKNYDRILRHIHGDYKRIFPLADRIRETMEHYEGLKKRAKI